MATIIALLCHGVRIIAPEHDWRWLRAIVRRLEARATPSDRFHKLVPPWRTLDRGIELMEEALAMPPTPHHEREIQYRDGMMLAVLSCWPIRRRGFTALTLSRHVRGDHERVELLVHPEDTKEKRAEYWQVPDELLPYLVRYLDEIRPAFPGADAHDGLWASTWARPLCSQQIYNRMRRHTRAAFGKAMGLHDFRRAAATFLAMEAPDKVGLIPGVLQHTTPVPGERHYNQARAIQASRRASATMSALRARLRPHLAPQKD